MRFIVLPEQDFSDRMGGSIGQLVFSDGDEVEDFLDDDTDRVMVQFDDETPVTDWMTPDQWRAWWATNRQMYA